MNASKSIEMLAFSPYRYRREAIGRQNTSMKGAVESMWYNRRMKIHSLKIKDLPIGARCVQMRWSAVTIPRRQSFGTMRAMI